MSFDLSTIFSIQKSYLTDLSYLNQSGNEHAVNLKLTDLNNSLGDLNTDIKKSNGAAENAYTYQKDLYRIIHSEKERLDKKKQQMDDVIVGQQRIISLNESYRKRYAQYTQIVIIIVIALAAFYSLSLIQTTFPGIPSILIDLLIVVLISISIIYCGYLYMDILKRDNMNYDLLSDGDNAIQSANSVKHDTGHNTKKTKHQKKNSKNIMVGGSKYCGRGTTWDQKLKKCEITGAKKKKTAAKAYSHSEGTDYSVYKKKL